MANLINAFKMAHCFFLLNKNSDWGGLEVGMVASYSSNPAEVYILSKSSNKEKGL